MTEAQRRLRAVGRSTRLWADPGLSRADDGWWAAFSGHRHVGYNVALCHADGSRSLPAALECVSERAVPGVIMAADTVLGDVQLLADAGWVCVGMTPLMRAEPPPAAETGPDPAVRQLRPDDRDEARALVAAAFGLDDVTASVALPDHAFTSEDIVVMGLDDDETLASCVTAVLDAAVAVVWSTATPPASQRRGLGGRLMAGLLAELGRRGVGEVLLYSSPAGRSLYLGCGFLDVTPLQIWSRPRWVLGGVG